MLDHVAGRRVRRCVFAALAVVAAVLSVAVAPPAARAAGAEVSSWADALSALKGSADPVTYTVSSDTVPGETLTVPAGRTLVVKGSGSLAGGTTGASLFKVEKGGTLVLDGVAVSGNKVGEQGAVNVVAGGKLELGFADGQGATAPSITGNTKDGTVACNLVARSDSTIRLNAPASRRIGLSYASTVESPVALVESGARTVQASDVADGAIGPDNSDQLMVATNGHVVLRNPAKMLHWAPDSSWGGGSDHTSVISTLFTEAGCSSITKISGTTSSRKTFVGDSALNGLSLNQYDFIYIEPSKLSVSGGVYGHYSDAEISALASFLDSGGRIFIQAENTNFGPLNASAQELANALNAVFTIETSPMINGNIFSDKSSVVGSTLTEGLTDELNLPAASPLTYDPNRANAVLKTLDGGKEYTWCVDMQAGSTADGTPYGNITLITDINCWKYYPAWAAQFAGNLLSSSVENRNIAATGVSPNDRYEIVFDSLGGSEVDSQTLLVGAVVSKPEDPTRDGYDFAGWATDRAGEDEYDFATPVSGAMTLYAKWNPHTYVVDFNANAQNVKQEAYSQGFSYGTAQELKRNSFTRDGYVFIGWNTDAKGAGTSYADGQAVSDLSAEDGKHITLYAQWSADAVKYTVEHWRQNADDSSYMKDEAATQTLYGDTGTQTIAAAKAYDGFTAKEVSQKTIDGAGTTVVKVYYDRKSYTLSFDGNGHGAATRPANQSVTYGTKAQKPSNMSETGYVFGGWYRDKACAQAWDFSVDTMPASDLTLYAKWTGSPVQYKVQHWKQNADGSYAQDMAAAQTLTGETGTYTKAEPLDYEGYVALPVVQLMIKADGTTTIVIKYDIVYKLSFDANGVSGASMPASMELKPGAALDEPDTKPTAPGHAFVGWYQEAACENVFDFTGTMPTNDVIVYAKWTTDASYKVEHYLQNMDDDSYPAKPEATDSKTGTIGQKTAAEAKVYPGFAAGEVTQVEIAVDGSTVVKIYYARVRHDVTFDAKDHGVVPAKLTGVKYGAKVTNPGDLSADGYTFGGWYTDESFAEAKKWDFSTGTMPDKDLTLYAKWTANTDTKYKVEHYLQNVDNDEYTLQSDDTETKQGTTDTKTKAEAKTTYTGFTAKSFDQENIAGDGLTVVRIHYTRDRHDVTFDAKGHGDVPAKLTGVKYGAKVTNPGDLSQDGYTFGGWYTDDSFADGKKWDFDTSTMPDKNLTLYAKWAANMYTVEFDANGGEGVMPAQSFTYDETEKALSANLFTRTGYTFVGWKDEASGETYADGQVVRNLSAEKDGTVTLHAQWTANTYTVVFDANGGTGSMPAQPFTYDTAQSLAGNAFERTGYTFKGWTLFRDGSGTLYTDGESVKNLIDQPAGAQAARLLLADAAADVTLYAQWTANGYMVKFDANGGTGDMAAQPFAYDEARELSANVFARAGYLFVGWDTQADGTGMSYTDGQSVNNLSAEKDGTVTLYAQWSAEASRYTVGHYLQGSDGSYPTEPDVVETLNGLTDSRTSVVAKAYEGFTAESFDQQTIRADGSTVVSIRYARNSYTVRFDANGHGTAPAGLAGVKYGSLLDNPGDPSAEGYAFGGWYADEACSKAWDFTSDTMPAGNVTLYAKWTANEYAITYDPAGGTLPADAPKRHTYGEETKLPTPARAGYTFDGWYDEAGNKIDIISADAKDLKVTAKWTGNTYDITYDLNGGTLPDSAPKKHTYGTETKLPTPARAGYVFDGWYDEAGDKIDIISADAKDLKVTAKWTKLNVLASTGATGLAAGLIALALAGAGLAVAVLRRKRSR